MLGCGVDEKDLVVVAFDGDCMLCSRGIRFLAERDQHKRLRFVPLQSPLGRQLERQAGTERLSTMIMRRGDQVRARSDGALTALEALGGGWSAVAKLAWIFPKGLRDMAYDFIAKRRHRWFGKGDACSLPSEALRERLIGGEGV